MTNSRRKTNKTESDDYKSGARAALEYIHCRNMLRTFLEYIPKKISEAFKEDKNPFEELKKIRHVLDEIVKSIREYPYRDDDWSLNREEAILGEEYFDEKSIFNESLTLLRQYEIYLTLRKSFFENYREMVALEMRKDNQGLEGKMMEFSNEILEVLQRPSSLEKTKKITL